MSSPAQAASRASSEDEAIPSTCEVIAVHVAELTRLFNAIDPSPFRDRDLDPNAEDFIVGWAAELPTDVPLALVVQLDRAPVHADDLAMLRETVRQFFGRRAETSRRKLRQLFRRGRTSLVIGVTFLGVSLILGDFLAQTLGDRRLAEVVRESFLIGGWVAMWGPMEIFLYDWWPIRAEARLSDRLSAMPVRISLSGART